MSKLLDLIREGTAPQSMVRRAAQGKLSVPPAEALELLVLLAADREVGVEAEQTLANWDERSLWEVCATISSPEVLKYLLQNCTHRDGVVRALCNNPALPMSMLEPLATRVDGMILRTMLESLRVRHSGRLLRLMEANPAAETMRGDLAHCADAAEGVEAERATAEFLVRNAEEVARTELQPFELVAANEGEEDALDKLLEGAKKGEQPETEEDLRKLSIYQKIGRMRVGERIKLAMRGNREERMVLIRDRSKLVAFAVLESPKVNEAEMEAFAAMKNVQETVLRAISKKRNYIKNYSVLRALANNPKTPLDVSMPLIVHLLAKDQRALAINKNVNETLRKMALRIHRKTTDRKKD